MEFHFLRPWWFLVLLPVMLIGWLLIKHRQNRGSWSEVCDVELLPFLLVDRPQNTRGSGLLASGVVISLAIIALAGPTWQRLPSPAFRNESALVIALDLSVTMDAADIKPSRIAKARYKIADLLKQRKDGQTALLVYGGDAFTVTPLTGDTATIASQLEALTTEIMPSPGRNTAVAVTKSVELLQQAGVVSGHILLVTDGLETEALPAVIQNLAGYQLSVLAVGTVDGAPIRQTGGGFVKDAKGNIVLARLDAETLAAAAANGKGVFQMVSPADSDIDDLSRFFNAAKQTEKNQVDNLLLQQWDEKGPWLLLLILPWAALRFRKGLLLYAGLCLLPIPRDSQAFDWQSLWLNANQQAQQAFDQQQYPQAAAQFENPQWRAAAQYKAGQFQEAAETLKAAKSADDFYNRGNALAKAGQFQEAVQAYQACLKQDPEHADARYNKALVEKQLQEQQKQQDQNQQQDQQQSEASQDQKQADQQSGQGDSKPSDQQEGQHSKDQQQAQQNPEKPENQPKSDAQEQKAQSAEPTQPAAEQPAPKDEKAKAVDAHEQDEMQRANEQLLKRIPDEPTGLLKRKFKYIYGQRGKSAQPGPAW